LRPCSVSPVGAAQGAAGVRNAARLAHGDRSGRPSRGLARRGSRLRLVHRVLHRSAGEHRGRRARTRPDDRVAPSGVTTRVVVLGSGGREHALAWSLDRSPHVDEIIGAPGNPGMAGLGECLPVQVDDPSAVVALADAVDADLVVIGPDAPVVAGVADALAEAGRRAFGPSAAAARLEGSKAWMKEVVTAAGVPTARYQVFSEGDDRQARAFLETLPGTYVI